MGHATDQQARKHHPRTEPLNPTATAALQRLQRALSRPAVTQ